MMGSQAWRFYDLGRRLERAAFTVELLRGTVIGPGGEPALLESALDITESVFPYRRKYLMQLESRAVIDLLLAEENNPRSVAFQLALFAEHLRALPKPLDHGAAEEDQELLAALRGSIKEANLGGLTGTAEEQQSFLDGLLQKIWQLSDTVAEAYFSHTTVSQAQDTGRQDRSL
jgi:uncharacterized alpha-E superfamily protein